MSGGQSGLNRAYCPTCKMENSFRHEHDTAHGIPGTHMEGSERYVCITCDLTVWPSMAGQFPTLPFTLDRVFGQDKRLAPPEDTPQPKPGSVRIINDTGHGFQTRVEVWSPIDGWTLMRGVQSVKVVCDLGKPLHAFIQVSPVTAHFSALTLVEAKGEPTT